MMLEDIQGFSIYQQPDRTGRVYFYHKTDPSKIIKVASTDRAKQQNIKEYLVFSTNKTDERYVSVYGLYNEGHINYLICDNVRIFKDVVFIDILDEDKKISSSMHNIKYTLKENAKTKMLDDGVKSWLEKAYIESKKEFHKHILKADMEDLLNGRFDPLKDCSIHSLSNLGLTKKKKLVLLSI